MLSKADIFDAVDYESVEVEVPEWGGSVLIRPMTVADREQIEKAIKSEVTNNHIMALTLSFSIVDDKGNRLFTKTDIEKLKNKKGQVVSRLYNECIALNSPPEEGND